MNDNMEGSVTPENDVTGLHNAAAQDATQRVRLDSAPIAPTARRTSPSRSSSAAARKRKADRKRKQKIAVIIIAIVAVLLLVLAGILLIHSMSQTEDDGKILNNVYAAGVNLGGLTPEQAKAVLAAATADTYSRIPMVVTVHDTVVEMTPQNTNAKLDVDSVVQAAFNYGRTGTRAEQEKAKALSATSSYNLSILPYLSLDTDYIHDVVNGLGDKYSSTLAQPSHVVNGSQPILNPGTENVDCITVFQTITVSVGTPEYGLDIGKLYKQILEAYDMNIFQVSAEITVVSPDEVDIDALYAKYCVSPVDAELDTATYQVTPEKYGYGFSLQDAREVLSSASYGDEITLELRYIRPNFTADELAGDLFTDVLSSITIPMPEDKAMQVNIALAVRELAGTMLKSDQEFSFNVLLGRPVQSLGYKPALVLVNKQEQTVVGGGISYLSSALYYCALSADLEITERNAHAYAQDYIVPGLDAEVYYGQKDLCFRNTTARPIRLDMEVNRNGELVVSIVGTKNDSQSVDIRFENIETYHPSNLVIVLPEGSENGHYDGEIYVPGITGYDVNVYRVYTDLTNPTAKPVKKLVSSTHYEKRNQVIISVQAPVIPTEPTEPPTEPTEPELPTEPTIPTEPTTPTEPTVPTVPTEPTVPTVPTEPTVPSEPTVPPTEPPAPTVPPTQPPTVPPTQPPTVPPTQPTEPTEPVINPPKPLEPRPTNPITDPITE